jgi:hypothetical protein
MKSLEQHKKDVLEIRNQLKEYAEKGNGQKIIFTHVGSHSTREKSRHIYNNIDVSHLQDVISIDVKKKIVFTEPSVPMDKLVIETLKFGLLPEVVPEFPKITVGGVLKALLLKVLPLNMVNLMIVVLNTTL